MIWNYDADTDEWTLAYWEHLWPNTKECDSCGDAEGCKPKPPRVTYTGGYNTTMIWNYDADTDEWTLAYWEHLWPNTKECDSCGDAEGCKPKPPKKKDDDKDKKKDDDKNRRNERDDKKKGHNKDDNGPIDSGETNTTVVPKEKPRYGPPAVNLRITMWDEEGNGWWKDDYTGNSWYLADDTRTELFFTGTLCDGKSGYCNLCLGDGSYTIRFTGNETDDFISWDFCGVRGEYAQELSFHVKKGKCIPDSLVNLEQICANTVSSTVTLNGVLALGGFTSEVFNVADTSIISRVLGEYVTGWSETLNVVSTSLDTRSMSLSNRRLSEHTFDVAFEVSFNAEKLYGVDGRDFAAVESLVSDIGDTLANRIASTQFISLLADAGHVSSNSHLAQVRAAELVTLKLDGITYEGVAVMEQSTLPTYNSADWGTVTHTESKYNYTTLSIFFGAVAVGFFAFVGILSHSMNGYKPVSDDSQHPVTYSMPEVMPSEMDQSIAGPSRIMGGQVGSGYARSTL
eukprot:CAMPEP_0174825154 /NCGR_PEP_ID=MMETSP1107-20130205/42489_1 /TAXON_ID=36770 /ORGANISM="Paraphysomonas vestita, Strain GFlagA" /LENGTH=512 /DNA_ID=CAMNT_0016056519 /DNA_START=824 /DNA_END=2363 /DNA_ORIENTATION=-